MILSFRLSAVFSLVAIAIAIGGGVVFMLKSLKGWP